MYGGKLKQIWVPKKKENADSSENVPVSGETHPVYPGAESSKNEIAKVKLLSRLSATSGDHRYKTQEAFSATTSGVQFDHEKNTDGRRYYQGQCSVKKNSIPDTVSPADSNGRATSAQQKCERELRRAINMPENFYSCIEPPDGESWKPVPIYDINTKPGAEWLKEETDERKQLELAFYVQLEIYASLLGGLPAIAREDVAVNPGDFLAIALNLNPIDCSSVSIADKLTARNLPSTKIQDVKVLRILQLLAQKSAAATRFILSGNYVHVNALRKQTENEHAVNVLNAYKNVASVLADQELGDPNDWRILDYKEREVTIENPYLRFLDMRRETGVSSQFLKKVEEKLKKRFGLTLWLNSACSLILKSSLRRKGFSWTISVSAKLHVFVVIVDMVFLAPMGKCLGAGLQVMSPRRHFGRCLPK